MKPALPYRYRVQRRLKPGRNRWALAVVPPRGKPNVLTSYPTRQEAISAANILAGSRGTVEVML